MKSFLSVCAAAFLFSSTQGFASTWTCKLALSAFFALGPLFTTIQAPFPTPNKIFAEERDKTKMSLGQRFRGPARWTQRRDEYAQKTPIFAFEDLVALFVNPSDPIVHQELLSSSVANDADGAFVFDGFSNAVRDLKTFWTKLSAGQKATIEHDAQKYKNRISDSFSEVDIRRGYRYIFTPSGPEVFLALSDLELQRGNLLEATKLVEDAIRFAPDVPYLERQKPEMISQQKFLAALMQRHTLLSQMLGWKRRFALPYFHWAIRDEMEKTTSRLLEKAKTEDPTVSAIAGPALTLAKSTISAETVHFLIANSANPSNPKPLSLPLSTDDGIEVVGDAYIYGGRIYALVLTTRSHQAGWVGIKTRTGEIFGGQLFQLSNLEAVDDRRETLSRFQMSPEPNGLLRATLPFGPIYVDTVHNRTLAGYAVPLYGSIKVPTYLETLKNFDLLNPPTLDDALNVDWASVVQQTFQNLLRDETPVARPGLATMAARMIQSKSTARQLFREDPPSDIQNTFLKLDKEFGSKLWTFLLQSEFFDGNTTEIYAQILRHPSVTNELLILIRDRKTSSPEARAEAKTVLFEREKR